MRWWWRLILVTDGMLLDALCWFSITARNLAEGESVLPLPEPSVDVRLILGLVLLPLSPSRMNTAGGSRNRKRNKKQDAK